MDDFAPAAKLQREGPCALLGTPGKYVKAHIIPAALTRGPTGKPLAQIGSGKRPLKRWSSWYDMRLVGKEGEAILADIDDWGIRELRKHQLVWRSWGQSRVLEAEDHEVLWEGHGLRRIATDPLRMRLFFLGLLWRAAATDLPEFAEIEVPEADLERLAAAVRKGDHEAPDFYPIMLTQLSSKGPDHNMVAIAENKTVPDLETGEAFTVPIFRFYFDGLIAHFHRPLVGDQPPLGGPMVVGTDKQLMVPTVPFEASWQAENLDDVEDGSEFAFPGEINIVLGKP